MLALYHTAWCGSAMGKYMQWCGVGGGGGGGDGCRGEDLTQWDHLKIGGNIATRREINHAMWRCNQSSLSTASQLIAHLLFGK